MKCHNCGQEIPDSAKVCGFCGTKQQVQPAGKACPNCHAEVPFAAKACGNCGHRFDGSVQQHVKSEPIVPIEEPIPQPLAEMAQEPLPAQPPPAAFKPKRKIKVEGTEKKLFPAAVIGGAVLVIALVIGAYFLFFSTNARTLLYDDFSDPSSGWSVYTNNVGDVGYNDGDLRVNFFTGEGFQASWSPEQYSDCVIETEVVVPVGSRLGGGLTFRAFRDTTENWYLFFVYPDESKYTFYKTVSNTWTTLADNVVSPAISSAVQNGAYQLKAVVDGDQMDFFIAAPDGEYAPLASFTSSGLQRGYLGPLADTPGNPSMRNPGEVRFRWIRISKVDYQ